MWWRNGGGRAGSGNTGWSGERNFKVSSKLRWIYSYYLSRPTESNHYRPLMPRLTPAPWGRILDVLRRLTALRRAKALPVPCWVAVFACLASAGGGTPCERGPQGTRFWGSSVATLSPLFTWRSVIADAALPGPVKCVAFALSLHMNERGGSCYPGEKRLARESGFSIRTVRNALTVLRDAGLLEITVTKGRVNRYKALAPVAAPPRQEMPHPEAPHAGGVRQDMPPRSSVEDATLGRHDEDGFGSDSLRSSEAGGYATADWLPEWEEIKNMFRDA